MDLRNGLALGMAPECSKWFDEFQFSAVLSFSTDGLGLRDRRPYNVIARLLDILKFDKGV